MKINYSNLPGFLYKKYVKNNRGISSVMLSVVVVGLIAVGFGVYYFRINALPKAADNKVAVTKTPPSLSPAKTDNAKLDTKINSFPVYPEAVFTKKQMQPPCVEGQYSGFSVCGSNTYTWLSNDNFDEINTWYREDKSVSGWRCSGGAGDYSSPRNASGTTSCKKGNLNYGLSISANAANTEIVLQIPYKNNIQNPTTPEAATQNFYDWYLECLNNHFADPIDQSPGISCPIEASAYASAELLENIKGAVGADPILCAQDTPTAITVSKKSVQGDFATILVHETFNTEKIIEAQLKRTDNQWRLTDVDCRLNP